MTYDEAKAFILEQVPVWPGEVLEDNRGHTWHVKCLLGTPRFEITLASVDRAYTWDMTFSDAWHRLNIGELSRLGWNKSAVPESPMKLLGKLGPGKCVAPGKWKWA